MLGKASTGCPGPEALVLVRNAGHDPEQSLPEGFGLKRPRRGVPFERDNPAGPAERDHFECALRRILFSPNDTFHHYSDSL